MTAASVEATGSPRRCFNNIKMLVMQAGRRRNCGWRRRWLEHMDSKRKWPMENKSMAHIAILMLQLGRLPEAEHLSHSQRQLARAPRERAVLQLGILRGPLGCTLAVGILPRRELQEY